MWNNWIMIFCHVFIQQLIIVFLPIDSLKALLIISNWCVLFIKWCNIYCILFMFGALSTSLRSCWLNDFLMLIPRFAL